MQQLNLHAGGDACAVARHCRAQGGWLHHARACTENLVWPARCCVLVCAQISPVLRILITRSVALVPALAVAWMTRGNAESTALDTLNQWLNLVSSSTCCLAAFVFNF